MSMCMPIHMSMHMSVHIVSPAAFFLQPTPFTADSLYGLLRPMAYGLWRTVHGLSLHSLHSLWHIAVTVFGH